jgi:hypothetical protein
MLPPALSMRKCKVSAAFKGIKPTCVLSSAIYAKVTLGPSSFAFDSRSGSKTLSEPSFSPAVMSSNLSTQRD